MPTCQEIIRFGTPPSRPVWHFVCSIVLFVNCQALRHSAEFCYYKARRRNGLWTSSGDSHGLGCPVGTLEGVMGFEPVTHSLPAPPGQRAQWARGSSSPKRSGPWLVRAEPPAPTEHTPRTRFCESPSPFREMRPVSAARPSVTPSRLGFPDPKSPPERAASPAVRLTSPAPLPSLPRRQTESGRHKEMQLTVLLNMRGQRSKYTVWRHRRVQQVTEGVYLVDGQEVSIEWRHSTEPGQRGCPIVVDGPMRQPLNKEFDLDAVVCTTALHQVPKDQRMTFDDKHKQYSRLEAMKVAKESPSIREEAADYTLDGKQVPDDLVRRYNKVLRTKVRGSRSKEDAIRAQEQLASWNKVHPIANKRKADWSGHEKRAQHVDCFGRDFNMEEVVVNFANVGYTFGNKVLQLKQFNWEGVRRCLLVLTKDMQLKVTGVIPENFWGLDGCSQPVPIPNDIWKMCQSLRPSEHQQVFDVLEKFLNGLLEEIDLVTCSSPDLQRDYMGIRDRVAASMDEWQSLVDDWKGSLLTRMGDLGDELMAAKKSETRLRQLLEEKEAELKELQEES
eukprot:g20601.t1